MTGARVQERFIGVTILIGVPVVFALGIISADPSLALLATAVAIGWWSWCWCTAW
jgi:hypothetical protein